MNEKNLSLFRLILAVDMGTLKFFRLLDRFGSAELVFKANSKDFMSIDGIRPALVESILSSSNSQKAEKELELAVKNNVTIVLYIDDAYPTPLRDFPDRPLVLYIKGKILEKDFDSISIVGSRKVSNYGKMVTSEFASYFAKRDITVVSGLARGVDTLAHVAALENKSRTIAVLGNGLLVNYPPENAKLQKMIPQNGAVISEFPLKQQPDRYSFPKRNRIIASFSKATLIPEAALGSGAFITARFCAEYGKDVFAVPGSIYSNVSKGTNELIKNGVFLASSPQDMADNFQWIPRNEIKTTKKSHNIDKLGLDILNLIEGDSMGLPLDIIAQKLNISVPKIASALLKLEMEGFIKTTPGQVYIRVY